MTIAEFKDYMRKSTKDYDSMVIWSLSNGDEVYFKRGFKKPHIVSPEPIPGKRSVYGDYGYEATLAWEEAFTMLLNDNQFEEE